MSDIETRIKTLNVVTAFIEHGDDALIAHVLKIGGVEILFNLMMSTDLNTAKAATHAMDTLQTKIQKIDHSK